MTTRLALVSMLSMALVRCLGAQTRRRQLQYLSLSADVPIDIVEQPLSALAEHATIPIAFTVERILHIEESGDSLSFVERRIDTPYVKDYDLYESPRTWSERFDVSRWALLTAFLHGKRVGGAVIAMGSPGLDLLSGRMDVAALWDIRVVPEMRRRGVGKALFRAAEDWAAAQGCVELRIETQTRTFLRVVSTKGCGAGSARSIPASIRIGPTRYS
jgi:GNAT superfamily N-acetyltransferase